MVNPFLKKIIACLVCQGPDFLAFDPRPKATHSHGDILLDSRGMVRSHQSRFNRVHKADTISFQGGSILPLQYFCSSIYRVNPIVFHILLIYILSHTVGEISSAKGDRMKYTWTALILVVILISHGWADDRPVLNDQKAKFSYIIGYQIGREFREYDMPIDSEILRTGFIDAFAGKEPLLTQEELNTTWSELQNTIQTARQRIMKENAKKEMAQGEKFLAENKTKKGVKTLPSGLQYRVIHEGTGPLPKATDTVSVNYRGTFIDGREFDSSYSRGKPASFPVNGVIRGWSEALQLMKVGAKWDLFIPPDLAYGEQGAPPRILPNSTLIFEIELLSIDAKGKLEMPKGKAPADKAP